MPEAKKEEDFPKSILIYSGDNKIFLVGLGDNRGIITEQKKDEISEKISMPENEIYFFTLLDNKEIFNKNNDLIS